ncbi:GNAT family N-acetyltransferase [Halovenus rubra]|uniref:GNAT family N-acetyltransferase n=2 Tax=Halovenus rubra TaxID=869890 RepID=A0ACC7DZW7_9EURY|nr:GNAT family N-acetyltransferase [Halovenus rubra]
MNIRRGDPSDSERIRRVSARSCRLAYEEILDDKTLIETIEDPEMTETIREWLDETHDDDRVIYLVACGDGEIWGFAQVLTGERAPGRVDDEEAYLKSLYVHPDRWGSGVGSELLSTAIDRLSDRITRLSLDVLVDNDIGRRFYEKHGFKQVGTGGYEVSGVRYDTVIYEKSLVGRP